MIKRAVAVLTLASMAIAFTGCSNSSSDTVDADLPTLANAMAEIASIRYYGYQDTDKALLESVLAPELAESANSILEQSKDNVFISLEDKISQYDNGDMLEELPDGSIISYNPYEGKETDTRVTTNEYGARGIYGDDVYVQDGKFPVLLYGDYTYIEAPTSVIIRQLRGNPSYKFSLAGYEYYDDNTIIIRLASDIQGAFEAAYGSVTIDDSYVADGTEETNEGVLSPLENNSGVTMTSDEYEAHMGSFYNTYEEKQIVIRGKLVNNRISNIDLELITSQI